MLTVFATSGIIRRELVELQGQHGHCPLILSHKRNPTYSVDIFATFREEVGSAMAKQWFRERECIHRDEGAEGESYSGVYYVQALQRLPIDQAMQIARKIEFLFLGGRAAHRCLALPGVCRGAWYSRHAARNHAEFPKTSLISQPDWQHLTRKVKVMPDEERAQIPTNR